MKSVHALEVYELDYWAALSIEHAVRIGRSPSGGHIVCWSAENKQMFSPSTRWRQASRFLLLMAREGRVVVSGGGVTRAVVSFYPNPEEHFTGGHETSLSVALIRCYLLWKFGPEVQDVPVQIN